MTTAEHPKPKLTDKLSWYTERGPHRVWDRFSPEDQERMLHDDLSAGVGVSLLLFALITTGMVLSIVTVLAVVFL